MNYYDFFYWKKLQGCEVIGMNYKKFEQESIVREAKIRYRDLEQQLDFKPLYEYFRFGLEVQTFVEIKCSVCGMVGVVPEYPCYQCGGLAHLIRVKEEGEDLFFEFDWEGYNYKFRRQNLKPIPITNTIFTNLKNITPLRRQFDEFVANMNFKLIIDYFEIGVQARTFRDNRTRKVLNKNDMLMGMKRTNDYLYTFMRMRVSPPKKPREKIKIGPIKMHVHKKKKEYFDEKGHPIDPEAYEDIGKEQLRKILRVGVDDD